MKFAIIALLALLPLVLAQVPIPYDNCGAPTDHIKVTSATASQWPPVPGTPVTIDISGSLDETLQGGSYILQVSFDGFPIVNQQGSLKDFPNVTWPIPEGPVDIHQTITVPSIAPAGSTVVVNASALDTNGQELICIGLTIVVPSFDDESDSFDEIPSDIDNSLFGSIMGGATEEADPSDVEYYPEEEEAEPVVEAPKRTFKDIVSSLLHVVGGEIMTLADKLEDNTVIVDDTPVLVPYTNCGQASDIITILNITSTVWPPQLGADASLVVNAIANEEIDDGTYDAIVSVDGFPLINKTGDISKYFKLPIQAGPVQLTKDIKLPSSLPFSGSIGIELSADDENDNELFCLQLSFDI